MKGRKFRAWDKTLKEMTYGRPQLVVRFSGKVTEGSTTPDMVLMQFTGLKDRLGKEIWEGDILRVSGWEDTDTIHQVRWEVEEQGYPAFEIIPYIDCDSNGLQYVASAQPNGETVEVIGNIYQHPELIEKRP